MNFENMNLLPQLLTAVKACGYEEPTPIQRETIPPVLAGRDVLGCAQTGTGKTAAFALPILQRLYQERKQHQEKRTIRALILTPTRELALQIDESFLDYGKNLPLRPCVIFGGVGQQPQVAQLQRGVDVLVATPGRLNDLIGQGFIALDHIEIFVLDEADRMLDMGFIHDVKKVIALLPKKRQTLLFSATMPEQVEKLALSILTAPVTVKVDPVSSPVDAIAQSLYLVDKANKKLLLASLLKKPEVENALVFTRTKHGADRVVRELSKLDVPARAIHGDKSQNARQEALSKFKNGEVKVLIATDIAARGIDIAGLSHVFNYDLPNEPESYIHRIGRTGRAGHEGTAVSFCCIDEMSDLKAIEKLIGKAIPRKESPWPMEVFTETVKLPRPPRPSRRDASPAQAVPARKGRESGVAPQPAAPARPGKDGGKEPGTARAARAKAAPARSAREGQSAREPAPARSENRIDTPASHRFGPTADVQNRPQSLRQSQRRNEPVSRPEARPAAVQAAPPTMRSTPLERVAYTAPVRSDRTGYTPMPEANAAPEKPRQEAKPSITYEQYIRQRHKRRSPFVTGQDRR